MLASYPVATAPRPVRKPRPDAIPARDLVAGDHVRWTWQDGHEVSGVLAEAVTFNNQMSRCTYVRFAGKGKVRIALRPEFAVTLLSPSPIRPLINKEV